MSPAEEKLAQLRAARDAARAEFLSRSTRIRALAEPGELGRRLTNDIQVQGRKALSQAMEIAADERGVLAGTLTALMLWLARKQIFAKAVELAPKAKPAWHKALNTVRSGIAKIRTRLPGKGDGV
ncbi:MULTISPECIES: hypothetical protein [unclassified Novosphingobium]|uniref:hypothetical protein n=1 Tax=unclassified Novosphingobium TaxID=2644732 RepID=UPI00086ABB0C|nr:MULTISPECIES: hypothetical protein [unclassified Novosphingobium]MBN9143464.1 hypothetical protein [Novosphingobium sp.]MDR6706713.1 hypothetical protein [Novosphingobium sp. 1748]ODU83759.1 MAG: hypothetical protein ABT10_05800 [Novosphingobium sp. SCN 63-17]OJX92660.1 MAG: hypothetical protein BGP00_22120 [Novosphingobium sp. 63-713]